MMLRVTASLEPLSSPMETAFLLRRMQSVLTHFCSARNRADRLRHLALIAEFSQKLNLAPNSSTRGS